MRDSRQPVTASGSLRAVKEWKQIRRPELLKLYRQMEEEP